MTGSREPAPHLGRRDAQALERGSRSLPVRGMLRPSSAHILAAHASKAVFPEPHGPERTWSCSPSRISRRIACCSAVGSITTLRPPRRLEAIRSPTRRLAPSSQMWC